MENKDIIKYDGKVFTTDIYKSDTITMKITAESKIKKYKDRKALDEIHKKYMSGELKIDFIQDEEMKGMRLDVKDDKFKKMNKSFDEIIKEACLETLTEIIKKEVHKMCLEIIEDETKGNEWRRLKDDKDITRKK